MFFNIYVCKTKSLPVLPFRAAYVGKRVKHTKFTRFFTASAALCSQFWTAK